MVALCIGLFVLSSGSLLTCVMMVSLICFPGHSYLLGHQKTTSWCLFPGWVAALCWWAASEFHGLIGLSGDDITLFYVQELPLGSFMVLFSATLLNNLEACRDFCVFSTQPGSLVQLRSVNSEFLLNYAAGQCPFLGLPPEGGWWGHLEM